MNKTAWYKKPIYLTRGDGGNAEIMPENGEVTRSIRIAPIISGHISDVTLSDEIAFYSLDDDKPAWGVWLNNFVEIHHIFDIFWHSYQKQMAIFDNHNHALYFWCKAILEGRFTKEWVLLRTSPKITLVHIDMHSDLWPNDFELDASRLSDLEYIGEFVNQKCTVANYIIPALKAGIIWEVIRIEWEQDLLNKGNMIIEWPMILNLDLDFFAEELDDVNFALKKRVILHFSKQAEYITIATSPFFIPGERALEYLKKIFFLVSE